MPKLNMVQALNQALHSEMQRDRDVVVLGQDIGLNGGVFRVTDKLIDAFGKRRVLDTPLAESAIVGSAIGMALAGLKPVAEIQFSGFSLLALGQLEGNAARYRSRTQGQWTVPMVVRMPYGGGVRALEHHSESQEATFASISGLKVVIPSGPRNARSLLAAAIRDPDPVVFMEPKHSYRAFREEVPEQDEVAEIGKAAVVKAGEQLTVVTWGSMLPIAQKAIAEVEASNDVSIELVDLQTISPLDSDTLTASVKKTGRCVVVQEASRSFSVASEVVARLNDEALMYLEAPVKRVANPDVVTPYFQREAMYMPTVRRVSEAIAETLAY